jgi:nucleoid DNA-binding protein
MASSDLPEQIQSHIRGLAKEMNKEHDQAFLAELFATWERKAKLFLEQVQAMNMELVQNIPAGDVRGVLVLSYSGSLLSICPQLPDANGRRIEYSSIKLRTDVPDIIVERQGVVEGAIQLGEGVSLAKSKLQKTSASYYVAVCSASVPLDEQDRRIRESTIFLTNGFMKFNRSLAIDKSSIPDQFTMKSMTRYLAKMHDMTGVEAKQLVEDFLTMVETGMLLGETVPLGRIGKLSIKKRDPQKARLVKHPTSGAELLVEAKPAIGVPKISFSSYLKDRALAHGNDSSADNDEDESDEE